MSFQLILASDFDRCATPVHWYNLLAPLIREQLEGDKIKRGYKFSDIILSNFNSHIFPGLDDEAAAFLLGKVNNFLRSISKKHRFNSKECAEGLFDIFSQHSPVFQEHIEATRLLLDWTKEQENVLFYVTSYGDIPGCIEGVYSKLGYTINKDQIGLNLSASKRTDFLLKQFKVFGQISASDQIFIAYLDDNLAQSQEVQQLLTGRINELYENASYRRLVFLATKKTDIPSEYEFADKFIARIVREHVECLAPSLQATDICLLAGEQDWHVYNADTMRDYCTRLQRAFLEQSTHVVDDVHRDKLALRKLFLRFSDQEITAEQETEYLTRTRTLADQQTQIQHMATAGTAVDIEQYRVSGTNNMFQV